MCIKANGSNIGNKSLWSASATVIKTTIVVGTTAGAVAVGGVAAHFSQPEREKISSDFQNLLDQTLEICEAGNYLLLPFLDEEWDSLFEKWQDNDREEVRFYQTGAPFRRFYGEDREILTNCFYNGEDLILQKNYTGYGIGINNNELAIGYFKDGKAQGNLTTILIEDITVTSDGEENCHNVYYVTKMYIENGKIINNVEITSYYESQNYYQEFERYEGSVSLVDYIDHPRRWEGYAFTDQVTWTMYDYDNINLQDGLPIKSECVFYMNDQGTIDRNRNVIEDDKIVDEKTGYTIFLIEDRPLIPAFNNIYVSMVYFDIGDEMKQGYNTPVK